MGGTRRVTSDLGIDDVDLGAPPDVRRTADAFLPLIYDEVRRAARRERRKTRAGDTMQTTALVHEAYLRLQPNASFVDEGHFLRAAALAMRHALINYARDRVAAKRGGGATVVPIDDVDVAAATTDEGLLDVNDALGRLARLSPRLAQVVECRFFAGFGEEQTARALGLSDRSVRRDWIKARAWLRNELAGVNPDAGA